MNDSIFAGLDVHEATISVAVAEAMRGGEVRNLRIIPNCADQIAKLAKKLGKGDRQVSLCYEAGPRRYDLHRQLTGQSRPSPRCSNASRLCSG
ncbi:hypothetical protein QA640_39540 [Bradyrhizobium sp. CB82]|uniref:hypothetical protein n=1 Tax=Bradyrhizobium sp. CB82 TaxID=3039159 RepID=UPI0024B1F786|nr:hypothetical protein [Bradyrhizobium sp. CB82]WFU40230.1 hypothetical protein QA640_39540 [Bradyrhizobium sp. CB82]